MSSNADIHVEQSLLYPDTEEQKKLRQAIGIQNDGNVPNRLQSAFFIQLF